MTEPVNSLRDQLVQLKSQHDAGKIGADAYSKAKARLERRLVDAVTGSAPAIPPPAAPRPGRRLWLLTAMTVLLVAVGGYWWTGAPGAIDAAQNTAAQDGAGSHELGREQMAALTEKLAARLKDKPDDAEGWMMLGRSYMVLEQPAEALAAYERAMKLRPDDAATLADYADALAVKNGRDLAGEPTQVIERALRLDPDNLKALMLAGSAAFNRNDYVVAVKHWDRMAQIGPDEHPMVQSAVAGAEEARRRGKLPPPATAATPAALQVTPVPASAPSTGGAAATALAGTVTLSAAMKAQAAPEDAVFVFARPAEGSRMPLAILRKQVKDLPLQFSLDDSMAMSPAAKISTAGRVVVGARVSKSGQAMPQPGDLEGFSAPVTAGASGIQVEIATLTK